MGRHLASEQLAEQSGRSRYFEWGAATILALLVEREIQGAKGILSVCNGELA